MSKSKQIKECRALLAKGHTPDALVQMGYAAAAIKAAQE
jgi:hypothetical protein